MDKKQKRADGAEVARSIGIDAEVGTGKAEDRTSSVWVRDDGAVCFGDECAVLNQADNGRLKLTVRPDRCGESTGRILVDYLVKTAGRGVVIEIPPEGSKDELSGRPEGQP